MEKGQTILYYLGRISTQEQWGPLTFQSLIDQLTPVALDAFSDFQSWYEGCENWKPVLDIENIREHLPQFQKKQAHQAPPPKLSIPKPPPLPSKPPEFVIQENKQQHSLPKQQHKLPTQEQASEGKDSRKFHRYNVRLRVIMRSDEVTFRTFTRNISAGGVALEHSVPDELLGSSVKMYISDPETEANIRFHAQVVPNRNESKFFYFTGLSDQESIKFASWLAKFFTSLSNAS